MDQGVGLAVYLANRADVQAKGGIAVHIDAVEGDFHAMAFIGHRNDVNQVPVDFEVHTGVKKGR